MLDESGLVETHAHAVPGTLLVENPGFVSGGSTLWLARVVLGMPTGRGLRARRRGAGRQLTASSSCRR